MQSVTRSRYILFSVLLALGFGIFLFQSLTVQAAPNTFVVEFGGVGDNGWVTGEVTVTGNIETRLNLYPDPELTGTVTITYSGLEETSVINAFTASGEGTFTDNGDTLVWIGIPNSNMHVESIVQFSTPPSSTTPITATVLNAGSTISQVLVINNIAEDVDPPTPPAPYFVEFGGVNNQGSWFTEALSTTGFVESRLNVYPDPTYSGTTTITLDLQTSSVITYFVPEGMGIGEWSLDGSILSLVVEPNVDSRIEAIVRYTVPPGQTYTTTATVVNSDFVVTKYLLVDSILDTRLLLPIVFGNPGLSATPFDASD